MPRTLSQNQSILLKLKFQSKEQKKVSVWACPNSKNGRESNEPGMQVLHKP
jgi:hypothetical protein